MNVSPTSHPDWYERYAYVEEGVLCWGFRLKRPTPWTPPEWMRPYLES